MGLGPEEPEAQNHDAAMPATLDQPTFQLTDARRFDAAVAWWNREDEGFRWFGVALTGRGLGKPQHRIVLASAPMAAQNHGSGASLETLCPSHLAHQSTMRRTRRRPARAEGCIFSGPQAVACLFLCVSV